MDRRIFFALAAIIGVCAAILLIPSHHAEDDEPVAVSHAPEPAEEAAAPRLRHSGTRKHEPSEAVDREPVSIDELPPERLAAREANEARRTTPFYQHTQEVGKRWMVLANTLGPEGNEELAAEMRTVSRELRKASLPSGTDELQAAALEHESRMITSLRSMDLDDELAEVRDYLEQAFSAVTSGEAPPKTGEDFSEDGASAPGEAVVAP